VSSTAYSRTDTICNMACREADVDQEICDVFGQSFAVMLRIFPALRMRCLLLDVGIKLYTHESNCQISNIVFVVDICIVASPVRMEIR